MVLIHKQVDLIYDIMNRKVLDHPESFQTIPETFHTIRKVSRPSGNFQDQPEIFQTIRKLSSPSGNFPDNPETFQTIWKSVHLGMSFNGGFHRYAQKLSRRAKTFQVAMPP